MGMPQQGSVLSWKVRQFSSLADLIEKAAVWPVADVHFHQGAFFFLARADNQ
jgi:hypothetical protein